MPTLDRVKLASEVSAVTVLVRGVLEWTFPAESLQALYAQAPRCWTRDLTVEALFWLVVEVVSGARTAVFSAYQADQARTMPTITVSFQAVYDKLGRMPSEFGSSLVRLSAERLQPLLTHTEPRHFQGLEAYRVVVIDGTDLGGAEHRLAVLRRIKAAGLPGRLVVAYDWSTGICLDATASEDAYTSERKLVTGILERAQPGDLYVMDRYYCTAPVIQAIRKRRAHFVIREDARNLRCQPGGRKRSLGRTTTGRAYERTLDVEDTRTRECFRLRHLIVSLDEPTEDGDAEVRLLTNLPATVSGLRIADLYRERWTLEQHFDLLKNCLHGEIESLGKPPAALFMMCLALVAANALAIVRLAIRSTHGEEEMERLSGYYLADELEKNYQAVDVLIRMAEWRKLQQLPPRSLWKWARQIAETIPTRAFHKHPRGPKRPLPKRTSGKQRHHYSIHRLLHPPDKIP